MVKGNAQYKVTINNFSDKDKRELSLNDVGEVPLFTNAEAFKYIITKFPNVINVIVEKIFLNEELNQQSLQHQREKKLHEAKEWLATLPLQHQEFVKTLCLNTFNGPR